MRFNPEALDQNPRKEGTKTRAKYNMITRQHSTRIRTTRFSGHHYVSVPVEGLGPHLNKFERMSSDGHQMSVARGVPRSQVLGEGDRYSEVQCIMGNFHMGPLPPVNVRMPV